MPFFVDANVLIYPASENRWRDACLEIVAAVVRGDADGRTSAGVIEEVWNYELRGEVTGIEGLAAQSLAAFSPLLPLTEKALRLGMELGGSEAGAYDRLHVGTCLEHGIETIVSADRAFDEFDVIRRVDPLDAEAVADLLG